MTAVLAAAQVGAQLALLKRAPKRAVRSEAAVFRPVQIVLPARLLLRNLFWGPRRLRVALLAATLAAKLPWKLAAQPAAQLAAQLAAKLAAKLQEKRAAPSAARRSFRNWQTASKALDFALSQPSELSGSVKGKWRLASAPFAAVGRFAPLAASPMAEEAAQRGVALALQIPALQESARLAAQLAPQLAVRLAEPLAARAAVQAAAQRPLQMSA